MVLILSVNLKTIFEQSLCSANLPCSEQACKARRCDSNLRSETITLWSQLEDLTRDNPSTNDQWPMTTFHLLTFWLKCEEEEDNEVFKYLIWCEVRIQYFDVLLSQLANLWSQQPRLENCWIAPIVWQQRYFYQTPAARSLNTGSNLNSKFLLFPPKHKVNL